MFSVPEGRAANQPLVETTFRPPIGAWFPGALVNLAVIGSPANSDSVTASGESFCNFDFSPGVAGATGASHATERRLPGSLWLKWSDSQVQKMHSLLINGAVQPRPL